jgi:hypothetical protein
VRPPSQILADQLTLSQPGGHIMLTTLLRATPDFQTLRRSSYREKFFQLRKNPDLNQ